MIIAGVLIFKMTAQRFVDFSEEEVLYDERKGTKDAAKSGMTLFEGKI